MTTPGFVLTVLRACIALYFICLAALHAQYAKYSVQLRIKLDVPCVSHHQVCEKGIQNKPRRRIL